MRTLGWHCVVLTLAAACQGGAEPRAGTPASPGRPAATVEPSPEGETAQTGPAAPAHRVWVAVEDRGAVVLVDLRARRVVRSVDVSGGPHNLTADGGFAAVALPDVGRIALIRRGDVTEVELGGSPHDVKLAGRRVVVANEDADRLDLVARSGRMTGSIPLAGSPHDLAVAPGGRTAWVSLGDSEDLALVDLRTERVRRYVPTGASPHDLLFAPDGRLWVTDWNGRLVVLSNSGEVERSVPLGIEAHHLAFDGEGRAWITDHEAHRIFVVDPATLRPEKEIHIPGAPHHVAVVGPWAAVADHDHGVLRLYRLADGGRAGRVTVGPGPHGVWAA